MRPWYRIRVTKSRLRPEWLCRLVPIGASPYDDTAILIGRYDTQPAAVDAGWAAMKWNETHFAGETWTGAAA